jgi:hypothetical protein
MLRRLWRASGAVLALAVVLIWPGSGRSSLTRLVSLGADADYLEDDYNVLRWYGSLPSYGNLVLLEAGALDGDTPEGVRGRSGGVNLRLSDDGRWGTAAFYIAEAERAEQVPGTLNGAWSISRQGWQAGLLAGWTRVVRERAEARLQEDDVRLGVGLRADLAARLYMDLAGELLGTRRCYPALSEDRGWDSHDLRARLFWGLTERVVLVPVIHHTREAHGEDLPALDWQGRLETSASGFGLGLDLFPDGEHLLVLSYEYRAGRRRGLAGAAATLPDDWQEHRLRCGGEARLLPWLSLRGAVRQRIAYLEEHALDPVLELSLGLGLHWNQLDLDIAVADQAPFDLEDLGQAPAENVTESFCLASLTYFF